MTADSDSRDRRIGTAVGEAIKTWDSSKTVAIVASGGLSHQLDVKRVTGNHHIPVSNTATAVLALEVG